MENTQPTPEDSSASTLSDANLVQNTNSPTMNAVAPTPLPQKTDKNYWKLATGILSVVVIAGGLGFGYLFLKQKPSEKVEMTPEVKVEPTTTAIPSPSAVAATNAPKEKLISLQGTFQDLLTQKCKLQKNSDTSFFTIPLEDLPFTFDPSILKMTKNTDSFSSFCEPIGTGPNGTDPVSNSLVLVSTEPVTELHIYDENSQELGHGGAPRIGVFGLPVINKNNIKINAYISVGEGPAIIGYTGLELRGVKTFETAKGNTISISMTVPGINGTDKRIKDFFKPYSKDSQFGAQEIVWGSDPTFEQLEAKTIDQFFGKGMTADSPEAKKVENLEKLLNAVSVK